MKGKETEIHDLKIHSVSGNGKFPTGHWKIVLFPACTPEIVSEIFAPHGDEGAGYPPFRETGKIVTVIVLETEHLAAGGLTVFGSAAPLFADDVHFLIFFDKKSVGIEFVEQLDVP
jgi:hypothetical protein